MASHKPCKKNKMIKIGDLIKFKDVLQHCIGIVTLYEKREIEELILHNITIYIIKDLRDKKQNRVYNDTKFYHVIIVDKDFEDMVEVLS